MLEISVNYELFRVVSFNDPVNHAFNMIPLEFWKEEAVQIHLLLKAKMKVRNHSGGNVP